MLNVWGTVLRDLMVCTGELLLGEGVKLGWEVLHNQIVVVGFSHEGHWVSISSLALQPQNPWLTETAPKTLRFMN